MTLLSDIVMALHDADVPAYSVHSSARELPGDPDLVVTTEGDAGPATGVLTTAFLPIWTVKQVSPKVIHVWGVPVA
jgi:hypothetical protein